MEQNNPQRAVWAEQDLPTLEDMYEAEHGRRQAPVPAPDQSTADDVARTLVAASFVCAELRRHAIGAAPPVAARCEVVADALDTALAREFGAVFK